MYKIFFDKAVYKQLKSIPNNEYKKIIDAIGALANNPRPSGSKKLVNRPGYRIRQGDYRIIYFIKDEILTIVIVSAGHRKDIYD
ncbi:MAG: hypothetical protein RI955_682 [Bacteroidota bacterium]